MNKYSETMLARRDYVYRDQPRPSLEKKSRSGKKRNNPPSVLLRMVVGVTIFLVAFVCGLHFITSRHPKEESKTRCSNKVIQSNLPPKPKERWRYIKELERRQPAVYIPIESSVRDELKNPNLVVTNKQHQSLGGIEANVYHQPEPVVNEIRCNKQTATQPQRQTQIHQEHQWTEKVTKPQESKKPLQPYQKPKLSAHTSQSQPVQKREKVLAKEKHTRPYQDVLEILARKTERKKEEGQWIVQCGSFKGLEQAETVRVQLAFEGFGSRIRTNNGWNRVIIGPLKEEDNVNDTIARLKVAGYTNCIRLISEG